MNTPLHTKGKEKNGTTQTTNIEGLYSSYNTVLLWRMEVFTKLDPDFATDSFKYTP